MRSIEKYIYNADLNLTQKHEPLQKETKEKYTYVMKFWQVLTEKQGGTELKMKCLEKLDITVC
jgi:hypothetical protein